MTSAILLVVALVLTAALVVLWRNTRLVVRAEVIRTYSLPRGLYDKLREKFPHLTLKDCQLVGHALRLFFLAYLKSGRKFVSMPSVVADELWHEFILHTRSYEQFCKQAFGRFMHHTPAVVLGSARLSNASLRRCWRYSCLEEHIDPRKPTRLPLLFALDAKSASPAAPATTRTAAARVAKARMAAAVPSRIAPAISRARTSTAAPKGSKTPPVRTAGTAAEAAEAAGATDDRAHGIGQ